MARGYDRIDINESDEQRFYGYDSDDGKTDWYTEDGTLDSITDTPSEYEYSEYEDSDD